MGSAVRDPFVQYLETFAGCKKKYRLTTGSYNAPVIPFTTVKAPPLIFKLRAYWNIEGGSIEEFRDSGSDVTLLCSSRL